MKQLYLAIEMYHSDFEIVLFTHVANVIELYRQFYCSSLSINRDLNLDSRTKARTNTRFECPFLTNILQKFPRARI